MTKNQGVLRIESELMVGMALLRWTPHQLSSYAAAIGYPVPVQIIEDGLAMSVNRFAQVTNAVVLANLTETLATLGIGFSPEVFGVVRNLHVRLGFGQDCQSVTDALGVLLQNFETPKITLAVQSAEAPSEPRSLVLLVETPYAARLLFVAGPVARNDLQAIVALLYSAWLTRLMVVPECITNCSQAAPELAVAAVLKAPSLPAMNLSKVRALQLLAGDDNDH